MISAVILAAGASTRMGQPKLLLPFGDEPLVRRSVRLVCDAGFDDVLVVVGHEREKVFEALRGLPARTAINTRYQSGMGSSFRTAVEHMPESEAAMFALADQPFVTTDDYRAVLDAYRQHRPAIVGVRYGEVSAPPHLFTRELFPALSRLQHGARPVLEEHRARMVVVQLARERLMDIDTPEDYERAKSRLAAGT
jgi:molybdenum cofactor cytidylyltransferase